MRELFKVLEKKANKYKRRKYLKETSRKFFIERIRQANSNIHLFGINFPNYFTTRKNKIRDVFFELEREKKSLDIFIYMPSDSVVKKLESLNIYTQERGLAANAINRYKLRCATSEFKYLKFHIVEYRKNYFFGASAIDLGTQQSFIHLSEVKSGQLIEEAEYFEIGYSDDSSIDLLLSKFLKNVK